MKKAIIIPVLLIICLCGCAGYKEIDTRYMVAALGFDCKKDYTVYAETVSIGTDNTTATPRIFKGMGETPEAAFSDLQKSFSKSVMLDHCAAIILSKDLSEAEKDRILSFCLNQKTLNLSARTALSTDIYTLLSSESETAAVGYDIYAIQKKTKYT